MNGEKTMRKTHVPNDFRLILGPLSDIDEDAMIRILTDDTVKKTYMVPDFTSQEQTQKLFLRLKELSRSQERFVRGIYVEEHLVGMINDVGIDGRRIELGYVIHPDHHNRGYCTEALKKAIEELFCEGFEEILAGAFAENAASIRVMEKAGMQRSERSEEIEYRGEVHRCVYYEIRL